MASSQPAFMQSPPSETAHSTLNGDPINPAHYRAGNIEVIDFIEDWNLGYHRGNAVKYLCRCGQKPGNPATQDIRKAIWYLERYLKTLEQTP
jgi:hypothetical protein